MTTEERERIKELQGTAEEVWAALVALSALLDRIRDEASRPGARPPGSPERWGNETFAAAELAASLWRKADQLVCRLEPEEIASRPGRAA